MAQPKGKKRIYGHGLRMVNDRAACECTWTATRLVSRSRALIERGQHLVDVRMDLDETGAKR
jgi:hypothetical protein